MFVLFILHVDCSCAAASQRVVLPRIHCFLWWPAVVYKDCIDMCLLCEMLLRTELPCGAHLCFCMLSGCHIFIHIQEWTVFCLHRLTLQCWHMSSSEFSVNMRLIVFLDAQVEHRQRWPLDSQEIAARSQQETSHSQQWIIWSGMLWFWRITLDMTRLVANAFGQYTIFTCFLLAVLSVPCNTGDRCTGGHFRNGYRDGWDKEQPELEIGGCFWRELTRWLGNKKGFSFCRIKRDQRAIFCWLRGCHGRVRPVVGEDLMTVASPADDMHRNTPWH